jgi:hypothetical protein
VRPKAEGSAVCVDISAGSTRQRVIWLEYLLILWCAYCRGAPSPALGASRGVWLYGRGKRAAPASHPWCGPSWPGRHRSPGAVRVRPAPYAGRSRCRERRPGGTGNRGRGGTFCTGPRNGAHRLCGAGPGGQRGQQAGARSQAEAQDRARARCESARRQATGQAGRAHNVRAARQPPRAGRASSAHRAARPGIQARAATAAATHRRDTSPRAWQGRLWPIRARANDAQRA